MTLIPTVGENRWLNGGVTLNRGEVPVAIIREDGSFQPFTICGRASSFTVTELCDVLQIAMRVRSGTFTIANHVPI